MNYAVVLPRRSFWPGRVAVASVALLFAGSAYGDLTPLQTLEFDGQGGGTSFDSSSVDPSDSWLLSASPVTGFTKFDPALGTLNAVLITVQVSADWTLSVDAQDVIDVNEAHSVDFSLATTLDAGVYYQPTNAAVLVSVASDQSFGPAISAYSEEPGPLSDSTSDVFGNYALYVTLTTGSILPSNSDFYAPDFVGLGSVAGLDVGIFYPFSGESWVLVNTSGATAYLQGNLQGGEVTLQYDYTPIPEPTSLALLAVAGALILRRRA